MGHYDRDENEGAWMLQRVPDKNRTRLSDLIVKIPDREKIEFSIKQLQSITKFLCNVDVTLITEEELLIIDGCTDSLTDVV